MENPIFDIQGHRGCRGLLPENTIPAFLKALDLGVNTLEMDVVISQDKKVLLSHEPFMSHEICLDENGQEISVEDEKKHNIYQMDYASIQKYDCGTKIHLRFAQQQKMKVYKPLLSAVIDSVENYISEKKLPMVFYNIETKCTPAGDNVFHPQADEFAELLYQVLVQKGIQKRCTIQSFDVRTLQYLHKKYPDLTLVLLIENQKSAEENINHLGFVPQIYSPYFELVTPDLVAYCKKMKMRLIPWTINKTDDMLQLKNMGVDGIITDYPDEAVALFK